MKNNSQVYCDTRALNLPPMPIDDSPHQKKTSRYTYDTIPNEIYVASENILVHLKSLETPHNLFSYLLKLQK